MASITLDHLGKAYTPEVTVIRDLSFDIKDGEFMVFVGPSGCGKSTVLRMIAGLETITSGTLKIGERVVNDLHPKDRDIAMVFQSYALYPHMTVYDNIAFGLQIRKERPALRRGDYQLLMQPQDAALAFARRDAGSGDVVVVLANRDDQPVAADIAAPAGWPASTRDLLGGETVATSEGRIKVLLAPRSVRILAPLPN